MRVLLVTIGQSPRADLVGALSAELAECANVAEIGLLDGAASAEIASLRAGPGQTAVSARMCDGTWLSLSWREITNLASTKIASLKKGGCDLVVFMATGIYPDAESPCPMVNAQSAVDSAIKSLAERGDRVGLVYPLEQQIHDFEIPSLGKFETLSSHAEHGHANQLRTAARDLAGCAFVVLNSVGYSEDDRDIVAQITGKPVILTRRVIANAIHMILDSALSLRTGKSAVAAQRKLDALTKREHQIMSLMCEGLQSKVIARQLGISPKTVEIHRSNILKKMDAPSSAALIREMVQSGHA